MTIDKKELEEKADSLERKAREEMEKKNYLLALSLFEEAKKISADLGFKGQVSSIEKKIMQIKNILRYHDIEIKTTPQKELVDLEIEGNSLLHEAAKYMEEKKYFDALKTYERAYSIFEKLDYKFQSQKVLEKIKLLKAQLKEEKASITPPHPVEIGIKDKIKSPRERGVVPLEIEANEIKELKYIEQEKNRIEKEIQKLIEKKNELKKREQDLKKIIEEKNLSFNESEKLDKSTKKQLIIQEQIDEKRKKELEEAGQKRRKILEKLKKEEEKRIQEKERLERLKQAELKRLEKLREEEELLKSMKEKEEKKNQLKKEAETALERGRAFLDKKKFKEAKKAYHEAINRLKTLGWFDQVEILYNEIKNIEKYETEYLKQVKYEAQIREERELEFQKRLEEMRIQKEEEERAKLLEMNSLPIEIKNKINKANLAIEKGEQEEAAGEIEKALGRYQFALSLFKSISLPNHDFSKNIAEIETKISKIKSNR
ncbi:MAG: hypothetical protein ACTSU4_01380 [Promethearchaeota archaeon]